MAPQECLVRLEPLVDRGWQGRLTFNVSGSFRLVISVESVQEAVWVRSQALGAA